MKASPCSFPIYGPQATTMRGSASLTTARIGRVADKAADCGTCRCTDTNAKPGPFRSGAGGCTAGEGDDGPDHENFTHDLNSTDGSPTIQAVSTQLLNI
jgi:hypothetical protein